MLFRSRKSRNLPELEWGVRESLTAYVAKLPDGVVAATGAADFVPGAHPPRFRFPEVSRTAREVRFDGGVEIVGHQGMLHVTAFEPWLTQENGRIALSVKTAQSAPRMTIAEVSMSDLARAERAPAFLTEDGAVWLGPSYTGGDPASTVTLSPAPSTNNKKGSQNGANKTS